MTTLTRALVIAALSVPVAASAQDTPPGSSPSDPSKAGETPRSEEGQEPSGSPKTSETETPRKEKLAESDLGIMAQYHQDNQMEIDLGKVASKRGSRPEVKAYGEMMVRDHSKLDQQIMGLAKKSGQATAAVKVKDEAAREHLAKARQRAAEIKKLEGANFDREYLSFMVEDHSHVLANIDEHLAAAQSPELTETLRKARPIFQQHLDRARELQQNEQQSMR
jgi:putative membrane protein